MKFKFFSIFVFVYVFLSILINILLEDNVYLHSSFSQFILPLVEIYIFICLVYAFLKILSKIKRIIPKILLFLVFLGIVIYIGVLGFILFLYGYSYPKTLNIDGKTYIAEKNYINTYKVSYDFYEEINWYSMKSVSQEQKMELQKEFKQGENDEKI